MNDGIQVDTGDLRVQTNRDWTDAYELNGAGADLYGCDHPAASGASDSTDLQSAMEYALGLFRDVLYEFSDATSILGSSTSAAAFNYDQTEAASAVLYNRMRAV